MTGVSMVVIRLHQSYVDAGKDPAAIRPFLTGAPMSKATAPVSDGAPTTIAHVQQQCEPVVKALLAMLG